MPAPTEYDPPPEGLVKVCIPLAGVAPFGEAPVSASKRQSHA